MTRGRLAIHAHLYQPGRVDPFSGRVPDDPAAAPARNWNERVEADCYRPNAARGNLERISFDLGPSLATWMDTAAPDTMRRIIASDRDENAVATGFHHSILPLASARDRRTEIRWGLRDFELRFDRAAEGFWLPEAAVDLPTLRALAAERVRWVVLAPWQASSEDLETRRPYRIELGHGLDIVVAFYDGELSGAVSFDPSATADADRFARDWILPRLSSPVRRDGSSGREADRPLAVVATDGELYGHHQRFRDLFLERLVAPASATGDRGYDLVTLGAVLRDAAAGPLPRAGVV
ncbi:MAG: glycosyl hydrolase family, partial [Chloroflexi bacterium]|nr:glycosyl hydrolase family [Chloroflexota bacterium]